MFKDIIYRYKDNIRTKNCINVICLVVGSDIDEPDPYLSLQRANKYCPKCMDSEDAEIHPLVFWRKDALKAKGSS